MKIKDVDLVNEYVGVLMDGDGDVEVGLSELMMGMYGWFKDDEESVKKLERDMLEKYNIKIRVNVDWGSVYIRE